MIPFEAKRGAGPGRSDQPAADLLAELERLSIPATAADLPVIRERGLDFYLDNQGITISPENLDGLYIILNCMRP